MTFQMTNVYNIQFSPLPDNVKSQGKHRRNSVEPYFLINPEDHKVAEGLPVRLRCEAEPKREIRYTWKFDDQILSPSPRRHQDGSDLVISRVNRLLDSGSFVCVATHEKTGDSVESSPAKIDVQCELQYIIWYTF